MAARPKATRADAPPAKVFPPSTEWTYGEPDLIVRMEKGFKIPASGPDFIPEEHVDPRPHRRSLREVGADHSRCVEGRAPRARLRRSARRHRHRGARPRHGLERRQLDGPDRVRRRQRRGHLPGRHDEDPEEGIDLPLRGPLSPVRRRTVRSDARRHQVLSEGLQARARRHLASHSHRRSATTGC